MFENTKINEKEAGVGPFLEKEMSLLKCPQRETERERYNFLQKWSDCRVMLTQCGQMVMFLFNLWPFTTMKICPVA